MLESTVFWHFTTFFTYMTCKPSKKNCDEVKFYLAKQDQKTDDLIMFLTLDHSCALLLRLKSLFSLKIPWIKVA